MIAKSSWLKSLTFSRYELSGWLRTWLKCHLSHLLQKLRWCYNIVVESLTTQLLAVAQNIGRLERFRNLDDILSLMNWCSWMWTHCSDGGRSVWHVLGINSSRSRHRQSRTHAVMTRHRVEIARQRVIGYKAVTWLGHQPRRCHVTGVRTGYVLWLVIDEVGPAIIGRNLATIWYHTRQYGDSIMNM